MTSIDGQIARFSEDHFLLTGQRPNGFVCPITLQDVSLDSLCTGHILNDAIQAAASHTVVQFADVDHYYGGTVEAELVSFLNFPVMTVEKRLKKFNRFFINYNGEKCEVFSAGPEAAERFPRVEFINSEGKVIGERYVRSAKIAPGHYSDVEAEFFLTVHDSGITAALLKSAYLVVFKSVGYRYGLDPLGSTVRRALAEFFLKRARCENAKEYFGQFQGAVIVSLGGLLDTVPDTLEGGRMLMHFAEGTGSTGILFAISCLFRVNASTLVVTLPAYMNYGYALDAMAYYRRLLVNREMKHSIHLTHFHGDWFEMGRTPLDIQHVSNHDHHST